jgi:hypothetical protein
LEFGIFLNSFVEITVLAAPVEGGDLSKIGDNSPPLKFLDVVGRQVMRSDGVYVDGSIQGIKVTFTADTGAARTVISSKLFRKIPNSKKPLINLLFCLVWI